METNAQDLAREIATRPLVYLMTVDRGGNPHIAQVSAGALTKTVEPALRLQVSRLGRTSTRNIAAGSRISLMWPPSESEGYTLIVNGTAQGVESGDEPTGTLDLDVSRAVLHRPGEVPPGTSLCGSDCIPLVG